VDGGGVTRIKLCLMDANWGESTETVYQFCRESKFSANLLPCHGRFVGAKSMPFSQVPAEELHAAGAQLGQPKIAGTRAVAHLIFDGNYWKSFIRSALTTNYGDHGALTVFGERPEEHRMLADQWTAERAVRVSAKGRTVDEWMNPPNNPDNHLWDGIVGCAVAASYLGASLRPRQAAPTKRRVMSLSKWRGQHEQERQRAGQARPPLSRGDGARWRAQVVGRAARNPLSQVLVSAIQG